jgi:hypothetical protein
VYIAVDCVLPERRHYPSQGNNGKPHGNGNELELWTVSDGNGFQILRFTEKFKTENEDLFQGGDE